MNKKRGIIAGMSNELIKSIIGVSVFPCIISAFADEVPSDDDNSGEDVTPRTPAINYEDLIAKARREEKEKQYKALEKLKTQISTMTEQHNKDLLRIGELENQVKAAEEKLTKAKSGDSEEVTALKGEITTLKGEKEALEKKVAEYEKQPVVKREDIEAELRKQFEAEYEVKTYKVTKLAEFKDQILVPELVIGDTKEDIDASIQSALERSAEIRKSLGITDDGKSSKKRTPKTPANPSVSKIQDTDVSLERLATMDVRSPEYAELRKQLGLR